MYEVPVKPPTDGQRRADFRHEQDLLAMVLTVTKANGGPSFRVRVTAPTAPVQVRLNGWPAVMELKDGLVNSTAWASATAAAAMRNLENCMFLLI
jgi:hypothetical protein